MSSGYVAHEGAAPSVRWRFESGELWRRFRQSLTVPLPELLALLVIAAAVIFVVGRMPIDGRGDYGQWLMTSRYYLGENVPDYRSITALPPLIPVLLAGTRLIVHDPAIALQVFNVGLLLALIASMYFVASAVFADRVAGLFAIALAFLVTDRFLELFAFGGLLQAGAIVFTLVSVGAFVQAGRSANASRGWWTLGTLGLTLAMLSHVGTGLLAVPVCLGVAAISAVKTGSHQRRVDPRTFLRALAGPMVLPLAVLAYWILVLLPASVEYVSNPASLNYRGADRLVKALESYWPTVSVIAVGVGFLVIGLVRELSVRDRWRRRLGPYVVLSVWAAAAWGSLLVSILTNASTDYPRFATPLMAPLVVAGAGGLFSLSRWLAGYLQTRSQRLRRVDWRLGVLALVCLMALLGFQKYAGHVRFYQPLDALGLSSVGVWLGQELTDGETVVSPVREGKWIEGVTGHAAVFSQPVRYTFRPTERQRSLVADAIVKSTFAVASGDFFLKFSQGASNGEQTVPRGLIVGANHRGEFLDLLQIPASGVRVIGPAGPDDTLATLSGSRPQGVVQGIVQDEAVVSTTWTGGRDGSFSFTETTILQGDAPTFELIDQVVAAQPISIVEVRVRPLVPTTAAGVDRSGQWADLYFPMAGLEEPHLRIEVVGGNGVIGLGQDGALTVRSATGRVHLKVTDLTTGARTSSVQILDPAQLIQEYDVAAVVLVRYDPAFGARQQRIEDLGYSLALSAGAYALMVRN